MVDEPILPPDNPSTPQSVCRTKGGRHGSKDFPEDDDRRDDFLAAYKATGKRLDVGQSCVRFRKLEDVPFEVIGVAIAAVPMEEFVAVAKNVRER